jgi:hypothetical protein
VDVHDFPFDAAAKRSHTYAPLLPSRSPERRSTGDWWNESDHRQQQPRGFGDEPATTNASTVSEVTFAAMYQRKWRADVEAQAFREAIDARPLITQ